MSKMLEEFNKIINELKDDLGEGLVACDIWHSKDAQSLAGFNSQPKAVALFNEVTRMLDKTTNESDFPRLGNYYIVHLENDLLVVVVFFGDYQFGSLIDLSKTTMGILISVALPKLLKTLDEAVS
ncbi:MAG: hypothetical protein R6U91_05130 [Bacillota bacterium]